MAATSPSAQPTRRHVDGIPAEEGNPIATTRSPVHYASARCARFGGGRIAMKALVYTGEGVALEERPVPEVEREDDVRIIVDASGICGTDRNIVLGHVPAEAGTILGHEAVGT